MAARSFHDVSSRLDFAALAKRIDAVRPAHVRRVLDNPRPRPEDALALVSPAAADMLPDLVRRYDYHYYYDPYRCAYCGFAHDVDMPRTSLTPDEALANARVLWDEGSRQLLLVTGEAPRRYGVGEMERAVRTVSPLFDSISIEVFPMSTGDYRRLSGAGVDGLVLYQETYDPQRYTQVHLAGRKTDYRWRLEGLDRGGQAGFRSLGLGVLLGLAPWRPDAVAVALHAAWLQRRHWRSRIAISFPRMVWSQRGFEATHAVSDSDLVQAMAALRIVLPDAEIVLSTREPADLRDRLLGSMVTRMSAGSRTSPGGYLTEGLGEQFSAQDTRPPDEIARVLRSRGLDPVWKDLDKGFRV